MILDDDYKLNDLDLNGNYKVKDNGSSNQSIKTKIVNRPFKVDINAKEGFEILTDKIKKTKKSCSDKVACHEERYGKNGRAKIIKRGTLKS